MQGLACLCCIASNSCMCNAKGIGISDLNFREPPCWTVRWVPLIECEEFGHVWIVTKLYLTNLLPMTKKLVCVSMAANLLAC
jgi:hypothetical protein